MTNFEYIMLKMKDVDLVAMVFSDYSNAYSSLKIAIDRAFWNWEERVSPRLREDINVNVQVWLTLQYTPGDWEKD